MKQVLPQLLAAVAGVVALCGVSGAPRSWATAAAPSEPRIRQMLQSGAVFIENQGQWPQTEIRFLLNSRGVNVALTEAGPRFQLLRSQSAPDPSGARTCLAAPPGDEFDGCEGGQECPRSGADRSGTANDPPGADIVTTAVSGPMPTTADPGGRVSCREFALHFPGARRVPPEGEVPATAVFHYYKGDPGEWREAVPGWESVIYRDLYPGIDLRVASQGDGMKYEFLVAPGADWRQIAMRYENIAGLAVTADGALAIDPGEGWETIRDGTPLVYQPAGTGRVAIAARFELQDNRTCAITLDGPVDPTRPLVIDPEVLWGTYIPSYPNGMAADGSGGVVLAGSTKTAGWLSGGYDTTFDGVEDGYVLKYSAAGRLQWGAFIGGSETDTGGAVAVDGWGNIFLSGHTESSRWVSGGYDGFMNGNPTLGGGDAFLVKLNSAGQHLWSTYIGGGGGEYATDVAVDTGGNTLVVGTTGGDTWVHGGYDTRHGGGDYPDNADGFAIKFDPAGGHVWSTFLGGDTGQMDSVESVSVAPNGDVFVRGHTMDGHWLHGGFATGNGSGAFLVKLGASGTHLWSTLLADYYHIAAGPMGDIYCQNDGTVMRVSTWGQKLWTKELPVSSTNSVAGLAVDAPGNLWVYGTTRGAWDFITGGFAPQVIGGDDAFVAKLNGDAELLWSSRLGGNDADNPYRVAVDGAGNVFVSGSSHSAGWFQGGQDPHYEGEGDYFVVCVRDAVQVPAGNASVQVGPGEARAQGAQWRRVGTGPWHDSGAVETGLAPGGYEVEFREVAGWQHPEPARLSVQSGVVTRIDRAYAPRRGERVWSTYLGGTETEPDWIWHFDAVQEVATHPGGGVVAVGRTCAGDWIRGGYDTTSAGDLEAFVARLDASGQVLWSSYLGGSGPDIAWGVAVDKTGDIVVVGETDSSGWVSGGYDVTLGGTRDAFVAKLSADGQHLWSTYLGGSSSDAASAVTTDSLGNIVVVGNSSSTGWVSGGPDTTQTGSGSGFVAKLSAAGLHLWSTYTYTDGSNNSASAVACAADDAIVVCGGTSGGVRFFGATPGLDDIYNGGGDGFVWKLSPAGKHLWWSYVGGHDSDVCTSVTLTPADDVLVAGNTSSEEWIPGGVDASYNGGDGDGFLVHLTSAGSLVWSTYWGGEARDTIEGLGITPAGDLYIAGTTGTPGWVAGGPDTVHGTDVEDGYVAKLTATGELLWSSYLGGDQADSCRGLAVAADGSVAVGGQTRSAGWTAGGGDTRFDGVSDGFVALLRDPLPMGGLRVTVEPAAAVAAGAGWRLAGEPTWRSSGEEIPVLPAGPHQVEFNPVTGWTPPANRVATVQQGETTSVTGTYVLQTGSLAVTLGPAEARTAGAQWRRVGSTLWRNSGATESGLLLGSHTVEFKPVTGWTPPASRTVTVQNGQTTMATVTYEQQTGSLAVTLEPAGARAAGAQWRRVGTTPWRNSGATESGLVLGSHTVEFKPVTGWTPPANRTVTVQNGETTSVAGAYVQQTGSLRVTIEPSDANVAGAQWRRVGTSLWHPSGDTEAGLALGSHTVEFKAVKDWTPPGNQTATVQYGQTAQLTARYGAPPRITVQPAGGTLKVGESVTLRVEAAGQAPLSYQWSRDGTDLTGARSATYAIASAQLTDAGNYTVVVSNGAGQVVSEPAELDVYLPAALSGVVNDALTGALVPGVTVGAGGRTAITDAQGRYTLTDLHEGRLAAGFEAEVTRGWSPLTVSFRNRSSRRALTVTGNKDGYVTYRNTEVVVKPGQTTALNFSVSPELAQGGLRAVLNWGALPEDLDLHLRVVGTEVHISHQQKVVAGYGQLDRDDHEGGVGPETITVDPVRDALYHFYVHDPFFWKPGMLAGSAAELHWYQGNTELKVVQVPAGGQEFYWHVGVVDGASGAITVINRLSESEALPTGWQSGGGSVASAYHWDFGDGTTSGEEHPVQRYVLPGVYRVRLVVTEPEGQQDVAVKEGYVTVFAPAQPWLGIEQGAGGLELIVRGKAGLNYQIEASWALGPEAAWTGIWNSTMGVGEKRWTDPLAGTSARRYYRAVLVP